ncbi:MAG: PolC-type DNA polymerase III N-terminal domain-containing protein, partial [Bacillota bacterium]
MRLGELLERIGCSGDSDLESVLIKEVSVLVEQKAWRMVLVVEQPIPAARLNSLSREITNHVEDLEMVQVVTQPRDPSTC